MTGGVRDVSPSQASAYDIAPPRPASLAESLRAFGYDVATAIADLVDNSITAGARQVWIDFLWSGPDSAIVVTDDGRGMTVEQLVTAMRLGSQNPRESRAAHDLGRFGLGLKTASFSQCRRVTVRTHPSPGETSTRCWDLDHLAQVDDWQLLRAADAKAERLLARIDAQAHGTAVLWQKLDRLASSLDTNSDKDQQAFLQHADKVRQHLGLVFHRQISGKKAAEIRLNDRPIEPWDPFLENEQATQILNETKLSLRGSTVKIQPYVLPHQSKITKAIHQAAGGPRGWNAHQGFYVYRNRRLLVSGDWLGFGWAKEEHYKLARIRIDIPNSIDHDWEIDVTKSRAFPPASLRDELKRIGERTRSDAKRVYSHRGAKLTQRADQDRVLLWEPLVRHDKTFYRLNRDHPLLRQVVAGATDKPALRAFLRLVEETIPFPHITIANSERPDTLSNPFDHAADAQIREVMEQALRSLLESGYGAREAVNRLRTIWPFELFPALLASMAERLTTND